MMPDLPALYAVFLVLAAMLTLISVWSRRRLALRAGAVGLLAVTAVVAYTALSDLLSRPKPTGLEFVHGDTGEAEVLGATLKEGRGIYVWLRLPGLDEPRYYVMPWRRETAEELQKAMREAERNRSGLLMRLPFEKSMEERDMPRFYALPAPKMPDKPVGDYQDYRHPSLHI
jgi:hypothetical protein